MSLCKKSQNIPTIASDVFKLCHILKRSDFDGYGFNLHSEKVKPGQFIGKVDGNSPASEAGLKEGDRIIAVNGVSVGNETHKQVVQLIKAVANELRLLVIDVDVANSMRIVKDPARSTQGNSNNNTQEYQGKAQDIHNTTTNASKKRISNDSSNCSKTSTVTAVSVSPPILPAGADIIDRGYMKIGGRLSTTDPKKNQERQQHLLLPSSPRNATNINPPQTEVPSSNDKMAGTLQLPMTAADMRAKLMSKKKYDPKYASVDLKKKYEIIQKL